MALSDMLNSETLMRPPSEQPNPVRGMGGGMSDQVGALIDGQEPAAISEGEYVVPADVVSMLGDGSSEAGARILNKLIEKVRSAKQSSTPEGKQDKSLSEVLGKAKKQ